jgi:hypothetical protein
MSRMLEILKNFWFLETVAVPFSWLENFRYYYTREFRLPVSQRKKDAARVGASRTCYPPLRFPRV